MTKTQIKKRLELLEARALFYIQSIDKLSLLLARCNKNLDDTIDAVCDLKKEIKRVPK